jgi:hypothetical protein
LPIRPQNVARSISTSWIADIKSPTAQSAEAISGCASIDAPAHSRSAGNGILPVDQGGKSDPMLARNETPYAIATSSN